MANYKKRIGYIIYIYNYIYIYVNTYQSPITCSSSGASLGSSVGFFFSRVPLGAVDPAKGLYVSWAAPNCAWIWGYHWVVFHTEPGGSSMEFLRMIWDMETMETRVPRLALLSTFLFFFCSES